MADSWWGEDVVPRIRWRVEMGGTEYESGAGIPQGYGCAYRVFGRDCYVLMPIPLNAIVSAARALWWHLMFPPWRFIGVREQFMKMHAWDEGAAAAAEAQWRRRMPANPYRIR